MFPVQGYFFYMKYSMTWLTGKRVEGNLSTESQPWVKGGKGPACVSYECTHSYLKYLQQERKAPKFAKSYLSTLEHHFPLCFPHSWSVCTAGTCIGSSQPVCPHVLEECGNFGKRWIFQNKISSVLCRVAFRKWQISWICSELDDNTRQDQTLFSQEWHSSEWKRYCSVLPSPLLSINVNMYNVLFVLVWDFWALWPSHFKLSGIGIADTGTDLFCLLTFCVLILICTLHLGGGWFQMSC